MAEPLRYWTEVVMGSCKSHSPCTNCLIKSWRFWIRLGLLFIRLRRRPCIYAGRNVSVIRFGVMSPFTPVNDRGVAEGEAGAPRGVARRVKPDRVMGITGLPVGLHSGARPNPGNSNRKKYIRITRIGLQVAFGWRYVDSGLSCSKIGSKQGPR